MEPTTEGQPEQHGESAAEQAKRDYDRNVNEAEQLLAGFTPIGAPAMGQRAHTHAVLAEAAATRLQAEHTARLAEAVVSVGQAVAAPALRAFVQGVQAAVEQLTRQADAVEANLAYVVRLTGGAPPVVSPQRVPAGACRAPSPGGGSVCVLPPHGVEVRHEDGSGGSWLTAAGTPPFACRSRLMVNDGGPVVVMCQRTTPHTDGDKHWTVRGSEWPNVTWRGDDPDVVSREDTPAPPRMGGLPTPEWLQWVAEGMPVPDDDAPGTTASATVGAEQSSDVSEQGQGGTDALRPSGGDLDGPATGGHR